MKKTTIMLALVLSTMTSVVFAQAKQERAQLTEDQKVEMKEVHDKYAPLMKDLKAEMHVLMVEKNVLLTSQEVDADAVYSKVEEIGALKAKMQKQQLTARMEMQEIAPDMKKCNQKQGQKMHGDKKGPKCDKEGKSCDNGGEKCGKSDDRKMNNDKGGKQMAEAGHDRGDRAAKGEQGRPNKGEKAEQGKARKGGLELTEEQKEQMAEIKKAHFWNIQELENSISLVKAENVTIEQQLASVDKVSKLQTKLAKEEMAVKLEMMEILTEEQRMKAIAIQDKKGKGHGKAERGGRHNK